MRKLDKLVVKYFIGPFIVTFFISLFLLLMQFLWKYIDDLVGKGLEWYVILELVFYASIHFIQLALPLAVLLSSIMTMGNIAENNELMAAKSAGISLFTVLRPLIFIMFILVIFAFSFSNRILPRANLKFKSLLYDIRTQKPAMDIKDGVFYDGIEGYSIKIKNKDRDNPNILNDITIYDHTKGRGNINVIKAQKGVMSYSEDKKWMFLSLQDGRRYEEILDPKKVEPFSRLNFKKLELSFDLTSFAFERTDQELFKSNHQMLNMGQLQEKEDSCNVELSKNSQNTLDFITPYYSFYRDSMFLLNFDSIKTDTVMSTEANFIDKFPENKRKQILNIALQYSRSVKGYLYIPAQRHEKTFTLLTKFMIEWHRKITLSVAVIVLFFIGAPLGAIIRKGGLGMPAVVSVILFILYHVITISGEKAAKGFVFSPLFGMWMPVMILLPLGIILLYMANKDSKVFSKETYLRILKKIFKH